MNKDENKLTNDTRYLVGSAVVAALYAVLTLIVPMPQY